MDKKKARFDVIVQTGDMCAVLVNDQFSKLSFVLNRNEVADLSRVFAAAGKEMDGEVLIGKQQLILPPAAHA